MDVRKKLQLVERWKKARFVPRSKVEINREENLWKSCYRIYIYIYVIWKACWMQARNIATVNIRLFVGTSRLRMKSHRLAMFIRMEIRGSALCKLFVCIDQYYVVSCNLIFVSRSKRVLQKEKKKKNGAKVEFMDR